MDELEKYKYLFLLNILAIHPVFFLKIPPTIRNLLDEGVFIYNQVNNKITRSILQHLQLQQNHQEDNLEWHR